MPTATKSARVKTRKVAAPAAAQEENDIVADVLPTKIKKPLEIDDIEPAAVGIEEKIEEDPLIAATEEDETAEEAVIDGEELNPFGDRWEE